MKITFEELIRERSWLNSEILSSLPDEVMIAAVKDGFYEVKIVINGVELEPNLFNEVMSGIERYIDDQARSLIREELEEAENKVRKLSELVEEASNKIRDEFKLQTNNYD